MCRWCLTWHPAASAAYGYHLYRYYRLCSGCITVSFDAGGEVRFRAGIQCRHALHSRFIHFLSPVSSLFQFYYTIFWRSLHELFRFTSSLGKSSPTYTQKHGKGNIMLGFFLYTSPNCGMILLGSRTPWEWQRNWMIGSLNYWA